MSKVVLIPNGDKVYAVPTDVCEQYELKGKELEAAQEALSPDVEGQFLPGGEYSSRLPPMTPGPFDGGADGWEQVPW